MNSAPVSTMPNFVAAFRGQTGPIAKCHCFDSWDCRCREIPCPKPISPRMERGEQPWNTRALGTRPLPEHSWIDQSGRHRQRLASSSGRVSASDELHRPQRASAHHHHQRLQSCLGHGRVGHRATGFADHTSAHWSVPYVFWGKDCNLSFSSRHRNRATCGHRQDGTGLCRRLPADPASRQLAAALCDAHSRRSRPFSAILGCANGVRRLKWHLSRPAAK